MTSQIDPTVPVTGSPTTASVRANFATAQVEITNLQAAVAKGTQITIGDSPPASPTPGVFWFDSVGLQTYLWFDDGTSQQWVPAINPGVGVPEAPTDGAAYLRQSAGWVNAASVSLGRNLIHNSTFQVQQRGQGSWTTSVYGPERWLLQYLAPESINVSLAAVTDTSRAHIGDEAAKWALAWAVTGTPTGISYLTQKIEGVQRLSGKTVILSFWAQCNTAALKIGANLAAIYGTGGSPSAGIWATGQSITTATTWQRYSMTFVMPSVAGKTLGTNGDDYTQLSICFSNGMANVNFPGIPQQSGTFFVWGVQLEIAQPGQTAPSPLERIEYGDDLRRCQRFYQITGIGCSGAVANATTANLFVPFAVPMRANPTMAVSGAVQIVVPNNNNFSGSGAGSSFNYVSPRSAQIYLAGFAGLTGGQSCLLNTECLTLSADL